MERTGGTSANLDPGQDTALLWSSFRAGASSSSPARGDESMVAAAQEEIGVNNHIPVFLERTFRMIEQVPDDIVCWSTAGDSFVIKQVLVFEEILPSYFNHQKFMSFVRQLNFYGFKKTKGKVSSRSKSTNRDTSGKGAAAAAAATINRPESWEEFRHPQFRRGRRDLLAGIRRQKDGGRLKRKRADAQKSDIMSSLVTDVGTVNGDLKAVKGKLDSIMSLLLNMGSGNKSQSVPSKPVPLSRNNDTAAAAGEGEGGGGGGVRFGDGGSTASSFVAAESPASTARGGYGQWLVGLGSGGGGGRGTRRGGLDPCAYGTVFDYRTRPHLPADHQQHGWHGHIVRSQLFEQPDDAEHYPAVPHEARHPLPPLAAAVAACGSSSASAGPSGRQLPPLYLSPSKVSKSVASSSSSDRKQGGEGKGKGKTSPKASPQHRGDGSDGGVGTSPSSASADADPHDAQPRLQASQLLPRKSSRETADAVSPRGGARRSAVMSQVPHGLSSDGTRSMLGVLSESAASVAETEKEKHGGSNSSICSSSSSINSSSGRHSSFEYD